MATIRDDLLTNGAYGFPTRGHARVITPKVVAVVHITANMGSAQNQRDYANRPASPGPSAHYYIDRDGGGIRAIDSRLYAAWSNGDLRAPRTSNLGVAYLVALRAQGHNANEGVGVEIECVGEATPAGQWTDAQFATVARLVSAEATMRSLAIDATTVLPHAYINSIDRAHCPSLDIPAHMARLIAEAKAVTQGDPGMLFEMVAPANGQVTFTVDGNLIDVQTGDLTPRSTGYVRNVLARVRVLEGRYKGQTAYLANSADRAVFVMDFLVGDTYTPAPGSDCAAEVAAAVTADRKLAHITYGPA